MRKIEINGVIYYSRRSPSGYGFEIMKIVDKKYRLVFRSIDKDLVSSFMDRFMNGEVVTEFPDTSNETIPTKIVVYRSKHFTGHYSVPTLKTLDKTLRYILKQEYGSYIKGMNPNNVIKNKSGVNSQEEINSIPIKAVKEEVQKKWDSYQKRIQENNQLNKDYENLRLVVEEDKGDARLAMDTYEYNNWELEDLTIIT